MQHTCQHRCAELRAVPNQRQFMNVVLLGVASSCVRRVLAFVILPTIACSLDLCPMAKEQHSF